MLENFQGDSWGLIPPLHMPSLLPHDLCHGRSSLPTVKADWTENIGLWSCRSGWVTLDGETAESGGRAGTTRFSRLDSLALSSAPQGGSYQHPFGSQTPCPRNRFLLSFLIKNLSFLTNCTFASRVLMKEIMLHGYLMWYARILKGLLGNICCHGNFWKDALKYSSGYHDGDSVLHQDHL